MVILLVPLSPSSPSSPSSSQCPMLYKILCCKNLYQKIPTQHFLF
ncbi:hypothetical protein [Nostoc sp. CHAB 5715]|nr:hypothetical protein [Nostoc sp. CHAB 5715]